MAIEFLDENDIRELTGWRQKKKQCEYLRKLKIKHIIDSRGKPKVTKDAILKLNF